MFTGLIEDIGKVVAARATEHGVQLEIAAPGTAKQVRAGQSIAVNGCCLTLTSRRGDRLTFDLLKETLARTNLRDLQPNIPVNLERALRADGRLGGHFVQGPDFRLEIELPKEFAPYVASKASIAVNGISLTVADILPKRFVAWIIPYTKRHTNLDCAKTGDLVNLEFDILAKYVERMVAPLVVKK